MADSTALIFQDHGQEAVTACSAKAALQQLERHKPDLLLADMMMDDMKRDRTCPGMPDGNARLQSPAESGQTDTLELLDQAPADGVNCEVVAKPIQPQDLIAQAIELCHVA